MPLETILSYALTAIGTLLSLLIALVVYVFVSLKSEVKGVAQEVAVLNSSRVKLMHKSECQNTSKRIHDRLDEFESTNLHLSQRVTIVEAELKHLGARS